jgi:hypothetical protein
VLFSFCGGAKGECSFSNKHILLRTTICNSVGCIDIRIGVVRQFQLVNNCLVRPKHVAIECDFSDILKWRRDCERSVLHQRRK